MPDRRTTLAAMAAYYTLTGAWPLVHMPSFEAVTGRKTDRWLAKMVGALAVANGIALAAGLARREPSPESRTLAFGSIAAFTAIDVTYVVRGRISPIYLGDAGLELLFGAALFAGAFS